MVGKLFIFTPLELLQLWKKTEKSVLRRSITGITKSLCREESLVAHIHIFGVIPTYGRKWLHFEFDMSTMSLQWGERSSWEMSAAGHGNCIWEPSQMRKYGRPGRFWGQVGATLVQGFSSDPRNDVEFIWLSVKWCMTVVFCSLSCYQYCGCSLIWIIMPKKVLHLFFVLKRCCVNDRSVVFWKKWVDQRLWNTLDNFTFTYSFIKIKH